MAKIDDSQEFSTIKDLTSKAYQFLCSQVVLIFSPQTADWNVLNSLAPVSIFHDQVIHSATVVRCNYKLNYPHLDWQECTWLDQSRSDRSDVNKKFALPAIFADRRHFESLGTPLDRHSLRALYFFSNPASRAYFRDKNWQQDLGKSCKQKVGLWAGEKYFLQWVSFASAPHQLHPLLASPLRRKSVIAFLFSFIYLFFKFNFLVHHQRNNNLTKMCKAKTCFNERCCWSKD